MNSIAPQATLPDPLSGEQVSYAKLSYFPVVTFRSYLGSDQTAVGEEFVADLIQPEGGPVEVISSTPGQVVTANKAQLEGLPGYDVFFPALYELLQSLLTQPTPPPPPPP